MNHDFKLYVGSMLFMHIHHMPDPTGFVLTVNARNFALSFFEQDALLIRKKKIFGLTQLNIDWRINAWPSLIYMDADPLRTGFELLIEDVTVNKLGNL